MAVGMRGVVAGGRWDWEPCCCSDGRQAAAAFTEGMELTWMSSPPASTMMRGNWERRSAVRRSAWENQRFEFDPLLLKHADAGLDLVVSLFCAFCAAVRVEDDAAGGLGVVGSGGGALGGARGGCGGGE